MESTSFSPIKQRILLLELVNGEAKQISGWSRSHLRIEIEPYYGDWRLGTDAPAETSGATTMHSKLQLLVVLIMDPMPMGIYPRAGCTLHFAFCICNWSPDRTKACFWDTLFLRRNDRAKFEAEATKDVGNSSHLKMSVRGVY